MVTRKMHSPVAMHSWRLATLLVSLLLSAWIGLAAAAVAADAAVDAAAPADEADLRARLVVSAEATAASFAAAGAITDSLETGVRRVIVRVVDEMTLEVRFAADRPIRLPGSPYLCLVGPYWAPDDAGLSDRCWGEPDLQALAAAQLPLAEDGSLVLEAGSPVTIAARLRRGEVRCDYPPGAWSLEVAFSPPGTPPGPDRLALEDVELDVPPTDEGPVPLLAPRESRYCGLASVVVQEQGEPEVIGASPPP